MDNLNKDQRKKTMQRVRHKGTRPEMVVRRLVHGMGYRYRLHRKDLPGKPDLVFSTRHKVIFVHGCFWHRHDCSSGRKIPATNQEYWTPKLARNAKRDQSSQNELHRLGWQVLTIWECELKNIDQVATSVRDFLNRDA